MGKQCRPVAGHVVVERQAEGRALEQDLELALSPLERQVTQILAVELKQVERPQKRLPLARPAAQEVERGNAPGIGHHQERARRQRSRGRPGVTSRPRALEPV
jgi:hypothetical protein